MSMWSTYNNPPKIAHCSVSHATPNHTNLDLAES